MIEIIETFNELKVGMYVKNIGLPKEYRRPGKIILKSETEIVIEWLGKRKKKRNAYDRDYTYSIIHNSDILSRKLTIINKDEVRIDLL